MKLVKNKNIYVIEDNCDGWGTKISGRKAGSFGDVSITSFHAAHIVSMGVGGGVFTNNSLLAQKVRMYRDWGRQADINESRNAKYPQLPEDYNPRFVYEKIGYNFQILDLQAAMGRVQLRKIEKIKKARKKNFDYLIENLPHTNTDLIVSDDLVKGADVCWFAFPVTYEGDRGKLTAYLEKNGIETRSMFAGNITKHPAYANSKYRISGELTGADYILEHSFWISCHPSLTQKDLEYIVKVFDDFFKEEAWNDQF
jgi:CDP-6-deoxy-D-xylo-4-hexulose-3-dehydrase